jgi:antitoxin HicB
MSTKYPVHLEKDDNETILVTFPDYPGATYGHNEEEALGRAIDCLETYFIGCMEERKVIPNPSQVGKKQPYITLSALSEAKISLYKQMQKAGVKNTELARRLGWHLPQVDRLLDLRHQSRLDQIEQAFKILGKRLVIKVQDAA